MFCLLNLIKKKICVVHLSTLNCQTSSLLDDSNTREKRKGYPSWKSQHFRLRWGTGLDERYNLHIDETLHCISTLCYCTPIKSMISSSHIHTAVQLNISEQIPRVQNPA